MDNVVATDLLELKRGFFAAPEQPADWPAWRENLLTSAHTRRVTLAPPRYDRAAQAWASRAYAQGFVMLWDHELVDHATGQWQVDRLLDRAERDFGGYDLIVLWSNYPNSGVDGRHQLAYYDELPGGRPALKSAVARFHARGVRVLLDHKPWVKAPVPGFPTIEDAFIDIVRECDLDGLFLDCSDGPEESFRQRMADRAGPDKIFVSEAPAVPVAAGFSHIGCWQQMTDDSAAPGVYRNRPLERSQIICESRRYFHDPIKELQRGWMNGGGFVIWENVFGYWADYSPRCRSWMRLLFPAQRHFSDYFLHGEWEPLVNGITKINGCFVSRWSHAGRTLWTAVNRRGHTLRKGFFTLPTPAVPTRYVDVISGADYTVLETTEGRVTLGGWFERDGLAGIIELPTTTPTDPGLETFLQAQRERYAAADWSTHPWHGEHRLTPIAHVPVAPLPPLPPFSPSTLQPCPSLPAGMIRIPDWEGSMTTRYRMRECGFIAGEPDALHVYDAFEMTCARRRLASVRGVALDAFPVTNADFARFLAATGYRPADPRNFLAHWINGVPPPELALHPVVHVSRADARAYAAWAGKRLPTEEEWQAAAQGPAHRSWPWGGAELDPTRCNHATTGTTPVDAFPSGRTPEGIWDLAGNVWELTASERTDGHTRYHLLKGGTWFHVTNSHWLFDTGARPADWAAKHLLLCEAWDRTPTIGFRCALSV
jgi:hypothetical protein